MWTDPIVAETRELCDQIARRFNYDLLVLDPEVLFLEPAVLAEKVWENQQLAERFAARQVEGSGD